jgi:hypothetical protein
MFYSDLRQSNPPEALECRSVRFSVRQMNTLIESPFNHFKLEAAASCRRYSSMQSLMPSPPFCECYGARRTAACHRRVANRRLWTSRRKHGSYSATAFEEVIEANRRRTWTNNAVSLTRPAVVKGSFHLSLPIRIFVFSARAHPCARIGAPCC